MSSLKPLIFLHPLSKSLKELWEIVQENSEAFGVEPYELDALAEVDQLVPTLGPSVILSSSPKKCAYTVKNHRKVITNDHTKILIVSSKNVPRKVQLKLDKFGLNNIIVEPVSQKNLQYKVSLLLKSIKVDKEEEETEKTFKNVAEKNENHEQRLEKGVKSEEENDNEIDNERKEEKVDPENFLEDFKNMRAKEADKKAEERVEKDDDEEEISYEEAISRENDLKFEDLGGDLYEQMKHDRKLKDYEEDLYSNKKKSKNDSRDDHSLANGQQDESEKSNRSKGKPESLSSHMEGKNLNDENRSGHYKGDVHNEAKSDKEKQENKSEADRYKNLEGKISQINKKNEEEKKQREKKCTSK